MGLITLVAKKWRGNLAIGGTFISIVVCIGTAADTEKPFVSVCDRSEGMRLHLESNLNKPCNKITRTDLNNFVGFLQCNPNLLWPIIKNGDFEDLVSLEVFGCSYGAIEKIEPGAFSDLNALTELDLTNNKILEIDPNALSGLVNLNTLRLSGNNISKLHKKTFLHTPQLETLDLSRNSLTVEDNEYLKPLTRLSYLFLRNNGWTKINPGYFDDLKSVEVIGLGGAELQIVPDRLFANLPRLRQVHFTESPLSQTSRAALIGVPESFELPADFGNSQSSEGATWD